MKRTALLFAIAAGIGLMALALTLVPLQRPAPAAPQPEVVTAPPPVVPPAVVAEPAAPTVPVPTPPGPQTAGDVLRLTATLSDPYLVVGAQREVFLKIDVDAATIRGAVRAPVNLALVLDRSGSMAGEKIAQCRRAARQLVEHLDERDRFALVTFGSDVTTLIPSTPASSAAKERMFAAIDGILEMGGTNISDGIEAGVAEIVAYRGRYNGSRIILLSDGQANDGITDPRGLAALARRVAGQGVTLSAVGVGLDFNEQVMASLADFGGGGYQFLADASRLSDFFRAELRQAEATVAIGPTLAITPRGGAVVAEVYGYPSESRGDGVSIRLPDFSSGQHRKVVARLVVPASREGALDLAGVALDYVNATRGRTPGSARVAVSASVTSDTQLAEQRRDKAVGAVAAHAEAIQVMRKAGGLYAEGNSSDAERFLRAAQEKLRRAQAAFGDNKDLRSALDESNALAGSLGAPAGSAANSMAAKRIHNYSIQAR